MPLIFTTLRQSDQGVSSTHDHRHTILSHKETDVPLNWKDSTGQLPLKQRDLIVLIAFTRMDSITPPVKGPTSYLFNCLHREGPNNCLQVKGFRLVYSYAQIFMYEYAQKTYNHDTLFIQFCKKFGSLTAKNRKFPKVQII